MLPMRFLSILWIVVLIYAAICLLVFAFQRRLVYFPVAELGTTPDQEGLSFEDARIMTSDGIRLHGWFIPAGNARGVVLVCHGNAGNIANRLDLAATIIHAGFSVFLFDYRGYGRSDGSPSEEGTYRDAEAAHDYLLSQRGFASGEIVVYGESIGAAVAIELSLRRDVAAVVLESAFLSIPEVGARVYPLLPVKWLARIRYDNRAKIAAVGAPVLLIHSPNDEIVPIEHGRALFQLASSRKQLLETRGGHNDGGFTARREWSDQVQKFLESASSK